VPEEEEEEFEPDTEIPGTEEDSETGEIGRL
jgi:hypothetical protein